LEKADVQSVSPTWAMSVSMLYQTRPGICHDSVPPKIVRYRYRGAPHRLGYSPTRASITKIRHVVPDLLVEGSEAQN